MAAQLLLVGTPTLAAKNLRGTPVGRCVPLRPSPQPFRLMRAASYAWASPPHHARTTHGTAGGCFMSSLPNHGLVEQDRRTGPPSSESIHGHAGEQEQGAGTPTAT